MEIKIGQKVRSCFNLEWPAGHVVAKTTTNAELYHKDWEDPATATLEYNPLFDGWYRVRFPVPVDMGDGCKVRSVICMPGELVAA